MVIFHAEILCFCMNGPHSSSFREINTKMSYGAEKALAYLYPLISVTSAVCCITSAIAWTHWRYVLNACPETNCGCVLHGRSTDTSFEGGHIAYCHFATYGLILPLIFAVAQGIYHVYRVAAKRKSGTTTIRQRCGDMIVVTTESELCDNGISPYYWMPGVTIAAIMAAYTLAYAYIFTHGFGVTCRQYREALLKENQGVENIVPVIKGRLSCAAIYDFMDYLVDSVSYERRRYGRINTAVCLCMALISGWLAVIAWICVAIVNIVQMRRTRPVRI